MDANLYIGAFHMSAAELRACKFDDDTGPHVRVYDADEPGDELHVAQMAWERRSWRSMTGAGRVC